MVCLFYILEKFIFSCFLIRVSCQFCIINGAKMLDIANNTNIGLKYTLYRITVHNKWGFNISIFLLYGQSHKVAPCGEKRPLWKMLTWGKTPPSPQSHLEQSVFFI